MRDVLPVEMKRATENSASSDNETAGIRVDIQSADKLDTA